MAETFTEFDPAEYLTSPEAIAAFVTNVLETGNTGYIAKAIGVETRVKEMAELARETGLSREQLYRYFSEKGNPRLKTLLTVMKALGVDMIAKPHTLQR